jgi:hypothetical protein
MPAETRHALSIRIAIAGLIFLCGACTQPPPSSSPPPSPAPEPSSGAYAPGLGELMSLQQMRHTKLWLAGKAQNWELADYEVEELNEGFADVMKFYPTHKDAPAAPKDMIPKLVTVPLLDLRQAIAKQNPNAFARAFDGLTAACNGCHEAMAFGFNRVQRPATNPYPNQIFETGKK